MRAFELFSAKDSRDAVALLAKHSISSKVRVIAGGTDLLADLKFSSHSPNVVVDISRAQELKSIVVTDNGLRIGALVTHSQIMRSTVVQEMFPALVDAAHTIGAVQTRNLGTLGGNLVTAVPSMDSGPTLMALEAIVSIEGTAGRREVPLTDFFLGPRKTVLKADEILAEIIIPKQNLGKPTHFLKFGLRKGQALALVNSAASFWVDWDKHTFVAPRIGLGAVAPKVIRAAQAEAFLEGRKITPEVMAEAGLIAASDAKPISDFRASAGYRKNLVAVLTKRALEGAYALAQAKR
ncbi:MAG TPA: xanthine dehydrogenase family protein subunit M [Candidatus Acidoferrales bacterium]|jgi:carbon-monoxide dehydrogenase medium subunit|nr:xanthine dehydrogenase family protein subunit M [Candidatus Acidoferrales bacterium]